MFLVSFFKFLFRAGWTIIKGILIIALIAFVLLKTSPFLIRVVPGMKVGLGWTELKVDYVDEDWNFLVESALRCSRLAKRVNEEEKVDPYMYEELMDQLNDFFMTLSRGRKNKQLLVFKKIVELRLGSVEQIDYSKDVSELSLWFRFGRSEECDDKTWKEFCDVYGRTTDERGQQINVIERVYKMLQVARKGRIIPELRFELKV